MFRTEPFLSGRPLGFYNPLKEIAGFLPATGRDNPVPDPLYRLPNLRPSRSWYGVKAEMKSAAKIAAKATVAPAPKAAAPKQNASGKGSLFSSLAAAARRALYPQAPAPILPFYGDDEAPYFPTTGVCFGGPKIEPT